MLAIFAKHGASVLARKLCEEVASRLPGRNIPRQDGQPYLQRSYLNARITDAPEPDIGVAPKPPDIGFFLHKFVGDDDAGIVHNHPWVWCASLVLWGSYTETRYRWSTDSLYLTDPPSISKVNLHDKTIRVLTPFDVNVIRHEDMHHVSINGGECWTLFVHGPRVSSWGFAEESTGKFTSISERKRATERASRT